MAYGDDENSDRDERTIYVGNLSEKMSKDILYELFFQAGPIERVSIPTDNDGRIKNFGFVTYKHLSSASYAINVFTGSKLFGKDLLLRNRNGNRNREQSQNNQNSLQHGYTNAPQFGNDMSPLIQQQLILMATGQANFQNYCPPQMFTGVLNTTEAFASTRADNAGSHRDHYVDRSRRHHREDNRSNRSKPYRRSRSRSPPQHSLRNHDRSPVSSHRNRFNDRESEKSNYHRWGKR